MLNVLPAAAAYFIAVSLSMSFDQWSANIPFLWAGTAIIVVDLSMRRPQEWWPRLPGFFAASVLAVGLCGRGWGAALPISVADILEAVAAAWLLSRRGTAPPLGSLLWLVHFVIPVGIVAPIVVGLLVALVGHFTGSPPLAVIPAIVGGHAFGNICFTPLVTLLRRGGIRELADRLRLGNRGEAGAMLALVGGVSAFVFSHDGLPILFLPVLPLILVSFRLGRGAAGLAVTIVMIIGTSLTLAGMGPIQLIHGTLGEQLLFLQFYFAATILTVLPVAADLEVRDRLHRDMRVSEERYRLLADHSTDILMHLEVDGRIRYVSPSIKELAGYDAESLIGTDGMNLVAPVHRDAVRLAHRAIVASRGEHDSFEFLVATGDDRERWFETHARAIVSPTGDVDGAIYIIRDVTARKITEEQLTRDATTDPLTGLPNRRGFEASIAAWLKVRRVRQSDCVAVFDIDHFKRVNDNHGHDAGDAVLQLFAQVMRHVVREGDAVARIGGEEFAAHFPATSVKQALAICERLRTEMAKQTTITGSQPIRVTISGGVAAFGHENLTRALKDADQALYAAKRAGRDRMTLAA